MGKDETSAEAVEQPVEVQPDAAVESDEGQVFDAKYVSELRKENAKYRTRAKELEAAADELQKIKDSERSQAERDQERIAELQASLADYQARELRSSVARKFDLPDFLAARLTGGSEEEMTADAEALAAEWKAQVKGRQAPSPQASGAGVTPQRSGDYTGLNPTELVAQILNKGG